MYGHGCRIGRARYINESLLPKYARVWPKSGFARTTSGSSRVGYEVCGGPGGSTVKRC